MHETESNWAHYKLKKQSKKNTAHRTSGTIFRPLILIFSQRNFTHVNTHKITVRPISDTIVI